MWPSRLRSYARRLVVLATLGGAVSSLGVFTAAPAAGGTATDTRPGTPADATPQRVLAVGAGITIRLPAGWRLVRGRLSDVVDPSPRLAVASFPVKLSRHECECGTPNPVAFPRTGAFLFVWEYLSLTRHQLRTYPRRPELFTLGGTPFQGYECAGPSDTLLFSEGGRAFQVEIYLGSGVTPTVRAQLLAVLQSFKALRLTPRGTRGRRR